MLENMGSSEHAEINQYLEEAFKLQEQGSTYASIREYFSGKGLDDEAISYIIRLVDEFVMEEEKIAAQVKSARFRMIFGALVCLMGILITYLFYTNDSLGGIYLAIALTPLVAGLALVWMAYRQFRMWRNHQPEIDDSKLKLIKRLG
jgi:hypothetical protein